MATISSIGNALATSTDSYPALYTRLANAVGILNSKQVAGPGTEFILTVDDRTNRPIVQIVDIESRQIMQELPSASMFALVNKFS